MSGDKSQEAYNQIADDFYTCLDKWLEADIDSIFALTASLDLNAKMIRNILPKEDADLLILDTVRPQREGV